MSAQRWRWWACIFAAIIAAAPARGDFISEAPLPKVQFLSCGSQCSDFVPARPLKHELPRHMEGPIVPSTRYSEGMVWLQYTVGIDGRVRDIVPIYSIGEKAFVDTATATVAAWTFIPATRNGKPVEQIQYLTEVIPITGYGASRRSG